jgi:hypothetical protein
MACVKSFLLRVFFYDTSPLYVLKGIWGREERVTGSCSAQQGSRDEFIPGEFLRKNIMGN